jgi:hypothetical protein
MSRPAEIAERLELLEAGDADAAALLEALREVPDAASLWEVADWVVPYVPIMEAVRLRARELGASDETARGYLAHAFGFDGDDAAAEALAGRAAEEGSRDPVLLDAWIGLVPTPEEALSRARLALERAPDSLRLYRRLANTALRSGAMDDAREAHRWLLAHETHPVEKARLKEVMAEYGW